jgi:hypothetical protein
MQEPGPSSQAAPARQDLHFRTINERWRMNWQKNIRLQPALESRRAGQLLQAGD